MRSPKSQVPSSSHQRAGATHISEHSITAADTTALDRREFLRLSTAAAAAAALVSAGCQVPQEATVAFNDMPEDLVDGIGRARAFRTVLDGSPVLVKTREGRPILVAPAPDDASGRGLSLRHHASLMDLYDPDRARGPLSVRRQKGAPVASNWSAIGAEVVAKVQAAGAKAVLLTGPIDSPAVASAIGALTTRTGLRHVIWSPLENDAASLVATRVFGDAAVARPRFDRADLVLGLGAEFLDRQDEGFERDFAARRSPEGSSGLANSGHVATAAQHVSTAADAASADGAAHLGADQVRAAMSRFIQFEGRLTLTGANADARIRVRDSQLALVGAALAHELIIARRLGPLAGNADVVGALGAFNLASVAHMVGVDANVLASVADELAAASGRTLVVAGGSASTSSSGLALELAALLLNVTLGAFEAGLLEHAGSRSSTGSAARLASLAADMRNRRVDVLIVAGVNPVYDAPPPIGFAGALAQVPFVASLNDRLDETSLLADALLPVSHAFECWGDAALPRGLFALQQPVIQPLFDTRGLLDVLVDWAAAVGDVSARAAVAAATANTPGPAPSTAERPRSTSVAWHYLRHAWASRLSADPASPSFDAAWNEVLRSGVFAGAAAPAQRPSTVAPTLAADTLEFLTSIPLTEPPKGLELQLYPHIALADGRAANNGWLHETPDPITRITWGGALSIAPRRFDELGLRNGDLVEVDTGHARLVVPAYRHAGMHHDQVALPLGLGRTACGAIGADVGRNAFTLRALAGDRLQSAGLRVRIRRMEGHEPLALAQGSDVIDRARRPIVPATTLTAYEQNPRAGTEQSEGGASAWPVREYPNARWAMAIDLSKCIGCGKCVIGCQAENNIPLVGHGGIVDGREMSWIRIDRYYDAPAKDGGWGAHVWDAPIDVVEEPQTLFEPMLCQHCENAPCETVCPFAATMHSADGLNQQIYNRCVGTRYCANNCPFKVRRFNFWEYSKPQENRFFRWLVPAIARNGELNARVPMQMKNNPEVTVRSRGVMEKCSFCVQRIREARAAATRDGGSKEHLPDGAVVPACMEACATGAITFGDLHAEGSRVAALAAHPRAMRLLDSLGVKPSISYLTKVRNDKA